MIKPRVIAIYLPQYYPIPENDEWWGKGFTEWTNVARARPLFPGHYQPKIPSDLGFYDLRLNEIKESQANLAKKAGIGGFCYWHYWFGNGKMLLEKPFETVLQSGKPDFPFCLGWANHSWYKKTWDKNGSNKLLIEQKYPGDEDAVAHFNYCLKAFLDERYIKIDNRPVFLIWKPLDIPNVQEYLSLWNSLAIEQGFNGIYFIGFTYNFKLITSIKNEGFQKVLYDPLFEMNMKYPFFNIIKKVFLRITRFPNIISYRKYSKILLNNVSNDSVLPCVLPNYDHTPRSGRRGTVLLSSPVEFKKLMNNVINSQKDENDLIFIKSWNEWGEGNYLEPDLKYGNGYLDALKDVLLKQ